MRAQAQAYEKVRTKALSSELLAAVFLLYFMAKLNDAEPDTGPDR